jgi:hypothetical protein
VLTTLLKCITVIPFLGSLFWYSSRDCAVLLLAIWTVAIGGFVFSNLTNRFLWIPVLLAFVGVFGTVVVLVIPGNATLAANEATLVMFIVSVETLKKKRRLSIAFMRQRG